MVRKLSRRPRQAEEYDEDEYEEEEEQEEEAPRRKLARASSRTASKKPGRRTTASKRGSDEEDVGIISSGWGGYKRMKDEAPSKWEKLYKPPENEEGIIKFLEDGPYANVLQHWIDELQGKKGFYCLGSQNDCPLCDMGDTPTPYARFNILDLSGDAPVIMVYQVGLTMTENIKKFAEGKMGPLSNPSLYFAATMNVTGKGKRGTKRQAIRPVKARDLEEDFGIEPLEEEDFEKWERRCWTAESLENSTREELEEIAAILEE